LNLYNHLHRYISNKFIYRIHLKFNTPMESKMNIKERLRTLTLQLLNPNHLRRQPKKLQLARLNPTKRLIRILIKCNEQLLLNLTLKEVRSLPLSVINEENLVEQLYRIWRQLATCLQPIPSDILLIIYRRLVKILIANDLRKYIFAKAIPIIR
jgi:hypothetical protein